MNDDPSAVVLLKKLLSQSHILGGLVVSPDGTVEYSELPPEADVHLIGALGATLFSNNNVTLQRMDRGSVMQMVLQTDQGLFMFHELDGRLLVILADSESNLPNLMRLIEGD
jgi:predicted regulator of Ras-like GTPase activity (Roadblock/LC7/MglB family)